MVLATTVKGTLLVCDKSITEPLLKVPIATSVLELNKVNDVTMPSFDGGGVLFTTVKLTVTALPAPELVLGVAVSV